MLHRAPPPVEGRQGACPPTSPASRAVRCSPPVVKDERLRNSVRNWKMDGRLQKQNNGANDLSKGWGSAGLPVSRRDGNRLISMRCSAVGWLTARHVAAARSRRLDATGRGRGSGRPSGAHPAGHRRALRLLRTGSHRRRMARQLEALAGVGQLVAVDLQYRQVLVDEIADIEIVALRAERDALWQAADRDLAHFGDLLAVDL